MSTTVTYKGQTLTTVENETKTLTTGGTWMEGDITLTDVSGGGTGEWTTEGIAQNAEPSGAITLKTYLKGAFRYFAENHAFRNKPITSITFDFENYGLQIRGAVECFAYTQVTSVSLINFTSSTAWRPESSLRYMEKLTAFESTINFDFGGYSNAFSGNKAMTRLSIPNAYGQAFVPCDGCNALEFADMGASYQFNANAFRNCYKLQTLVLRKSDAVATLGNISAFSNTPMRGYNGLSGTIYVPSALISNYQTASNWSTIYAEGYCQFVAIEGSEYEL